MMSHQLLRLCLLPVLTNQAIWITEVHGEDGISYHYHQHHWLLDNQRMNLEMNIPWCPRNRVIRDVLSVPLLTHTPSDVHRTVEQWLNNMYNENGLRTASQGQEGKGSWGNVPNPSGQPYLS